MTYVAIAGLTFNGHQCLYDDGVVVTPPVTPPATMPEYVVPTRVADRQVILTKMPWVNGAPRVFATLDNTNVWALVFKAGAYTTSGRIAGAEWQSDQTARLFALIRNRDSALIANGPVDGSNSPSIVFVPGIPPPRSGKFQVEPGETYTMSIWNKDLVGPRKMFMELYFS